MLTFCYRLTVQCKTLSSTQAETHTHTNTLFDGAGCFFSRVCHIKHNLCHTAIPAHTKHLKKGNLTKGELLNTDVINTTHNPCALVGKVSNTADGNAVQILNDIRKPIRNKYFPQTCYRSMAQGPYRYLYLTKQPRYNILALFLLFKLFLYTFLVFFLKICYIAGHFPVKKMNCQATLVAWWSVWSKYRSRVLCRSISDYILCVKLHIPPPRPIL